MDPIVQSIKSANRILVASHKDPDGDAVGSLLALGLAFIRLGKRTSLYNESAIPAVYQFLPGVGLIQRRIEGPDAYDAAVILDCGDLPRIGDIADQVMPLFQAEPHPVKVRHPVPRRCKVSHHMPPRLA